MPKITLESLDLAALLCSRVCHDVISPVGAIVNGLEVLDGEKDPSMREFALDLISKSSKLASARLKFARLAFGAAGSKGAEIDLGDAQNVAQETFPDEKTKLFWNAPQIMLPKNQIKLLLNLVMISTGTIPRGGEIHVDVKHENDKTCFVVETKGSHARIPNHIETLLAGESETGSIDAHAIQPFYTGMIAREAHMDITLTATDEGVRILSNSIDCLEQVDSNKNIES